MLIKASLSASIPRNVELLLFHSEGIESLYWDTRVWHDAFRCHCHQVLDHRVAKLWHDAGVESRNAHK